MDTMTAKFECLRLALQNGPCDAVEVAEEYFNFVSGKKKAEPKKTPAKARKARR